VAPVIAGIFVGGMGTRMGGVAKGLLPGADGEAIVVRTARLLEECGHQPVLVGRHEAYRSLTWPKVADAPSVGGPLGGLVSLLEHAVVRGERYVLVFACDMPAISASLIRALESAQAAPVVAPKRRFWEPFAARYDVAVLAIARELGSQPSLQTLLDRAGAAPLAWNEDAVLTDWDLPADLNAREPQSRR
jgi:molybdopterin-guanine dinucleotide biosynthesis protein A